MAALTALELDLLWQASQLSMRPRTRSTSDRLCAMVVLEDSDRPDHRGQLVFRQAVFLPLRSAGEEMRSLRT